MRRLTFEFALVLNCLSTGAGASLVIVIVHDASLSWVGQLTSRRFAHPPYGFHHEFSKLSLASSSSWSEHI